MVKIDKHPQITQKLSDILNNYYKGSKNRERKKVTNELKIK
jgi:hypothetical protein